MNSPNYQFLKEMLDELIQERDHINDLINSNLIKIKEADYYAKSFYNKEDSDFKVFSPRDVESVHKQEISQALVEKDNLEKENYDLSNRRKSISDKIDNLEQILFDMKNQGYRTLTIQEADRQRIARDLHDTSLQNLAHLVHKIELSSMYIDKDTLHAKLELSVVSKNLKEVIEEIRNTIFDLRPMTFDDLGMKATLERLLAVVNENRTYEMDVCIDDVSCENNLVLVTIYRVIQECITNIIKHADATKIYFHCNLVDGNYNVVIRDNGKGFTREEVKSKEGKHFGLSLIEERITLIGGKIEIQSNCEGTEIKMCVPVE